jgi:hypothetical protein
MASPFLYKMDIMLKRDNYFSNFLNSSIVITKSEMMAARVFLLTVMA